MQKTGRCGVTISIRSESSLDFLKNEKNVLIITSCTKSKRGYNDSVSSLAKDMYQGELFKKVKSYSETMGFDYVIISAKYGVLHPVDNINGYEMQLKTRLDVENYSTRSRTKTSEYSLSV